MSELLKLEVSTFLSWLGIFLTIYIGWKSIAGAFNVQYKMQVLEEQLEKAYLPIFRRMEPFLYKSLKELSKEQLYEALVDVQHIIDKRYKYIRSSIVDYNAEIMEALQKGEQTEKLDNWLYQYSWHIDYEFEKTRKKLYLPTRSLKYKLNKGQFKNKLFLWWSISRHYIIDVLFAALLAIIMTFIYFAFFR